MSLLILSAAEEKKESVNYFLAGIIDNQKNLSSTEREKQLVSLLDELANTSAALAVESSDLANEVERLISESGINPARAAALRLKAQNVNRLAGKTASLTESSNSDSRKTLAKCHILAVNRELGIVAIEAGARHGVFKGMVFHTLPGNPHAELRVTVTGANICGAIVVKGSINQLGSGMTVSAVENRSRQ